MTKSRFEIVSAVIERETAAKHQYGKHDCFFFPIAGVDAVSGSKLVKKYGGTYKTAAGAHRAMKKRKFKSLADIFAKHLTEIAPAMARIGDVVVLDIAGIEQGAICVGSQFVTRTEHGVSRHSLGVVKRAFKV